MHLFTKEITRLVGKERATTALRLDLILLINLWKLCDISTALYTQWFLALRWGGAGKSVSEFSRPLFSELMITWRESCGGFPLKGIFSLFAAGTQGCFHVVKRNAGDWISFACTLGILEKCCNFWKLFCEVSSEGSYFVYFYLVPQPSLVLRQHFF